MQKPFNLSIQFKEFFLNRNLNRKSFNEVLERSLFLRLFLRFALGLIIGFVGVFLFSSCSTPVALTETGYKVKIINGLSAAEAPYYQELSVVDCFVAEQSLTYDEGCKNELRNQAGLRGAGFLVIESKEQTFCVDSIANVSRPCGIKMIGRVYRKK